MNQIIETIKTRRSVRAYQVKPIPKEVIEEIIDAGRFAPSAFNWQPWRFVIVTNKNLISRISKKIRKKLKRLSIFFPLGKLFIKELRTKRAIDFIDKLKHTDEDIIYYNAPLLILVFADKKNRFTTIDCSLAAQNMMLAAQSLGIGSCYIGFSKLIENDRKIFSELKIPKNFRIICSLIFGYPQEEIKTIPNRNRNNIINWVE